MLKLLAVFFILNNTFSFAEVLEPRKQQLDSFVTNLPREIVRDLDSAHYFMHQFGKSNEERVFMFYGFFGIHFKYDHGRAGHNKDVKEYSPYYTCRKRSGVCRDFSALFKELCDRSEIPCFNVCGRPKSGIKRSLKDLIFLRMRSPSHAWNLVKFDDSWHLMDPTWTYVTRIEKYYKVDQQGRRKYDRKAKIPSRTYYDADSEFFYKKRSALHPAFYLNDSIPTFKSARRVSRQKDFYELNYDFKTALDSLSENSYYLYSNVYIKEQDSYCERYSDKSFDWKFRMNYLDLKHTVKDKITVENCEKEIVKLEAFISYLESEGEAFRAELVRDQITLIKERIQKEKEKAERLKRYN